MSTPLTTSTSRTRTHPPRPRRRAPGIATRDALLQAAALGGDAARADLADDPSASAQVFAAWRVLRRRADRQSRQLLRVAFDTGYGQAMTATVVTGE